MVELMIVCSDVYEGIPLLGVCHIYLIGSLWRKSSNINTEERY